MQTAQGAAREICEHYYPTLARELLTGCASVLRKQAIKAEADPSYNVYEDTEYAQNTRQTYATFLIHPLDLSKHELANLMLLIFYGYPEVSDLCWKNYDLPKDSFNRLFLLLGRYNKAIKRRQEMNLPKILRGIVLKEAECVEIDPSDIEYSQSEA